MRTFSILYEYFLPNPFQHPFMSSYIALHVSSFISSFPFPHTIFLSIYLHTFSSWCVLRLVLFIYSFTFLLSSHPLIPIRTSCHIHSFSSSFPSFSSTSVSVHLVLFFRLSAYSLHSLSLIFSLFYLFLFFPFTQLFRVQYAFTYSRSCYLFLLVPSFTHFSYSFFSFFSLTLPIRHPLSFPPSSSVHALLSLIPPLSAFSSRFFSLTLPSSPLPRTTMPWHQQMG